MSNDDLRKTLFQHEVKVLEKSKKTLANHSHSHDVDLLNQYKDLVKAYEKLLKMTIKTYKISDIQGKMLKDQEAEIIRVNTDLRKVEESRKRFISDISHEMGAPIRAMLSFLKIIVDGKAELEQKHIQLMYERISVVNELLKDLFDLSLLEVNGTKLSFEFVSITGFIEELCSKYEIDVKEKGINFVFSDIKHSKEVENLFVQVDLVRIEQVITNLINNAIKFTPSGGMISVVPELVNISSNEPKLEIKVSDTGSGIGEEYLPFIFERFYKGNQHINDSGTGLGLAISREIILKHNGTIQVRSPKEKGTTFMITLPIYLKNEEINDEA
jgi:signal transduction histidine kinase